MTDMLPIRTKIPEEIVDELDELWREAVEGTVFDTDLCSRVLSLIVKSQRAMCFDNPWSIDTAAAIVDVDRGNALLALSRLRVALAGSRLIDQRLLANGAAVKQ